MFGGSTLVSLVALALWSATAASTTVAAQSLETGSVLDAVGWLKAGEYLWMPQAAPQGPMLLIVNVRTQRAVLYRNAVPIAVTTVSTGRKGHRTPLGVYSVLEKRAVHFSSIYDAAPMPFMQRLTWGGVALHGGHLPGYPASHGCIRLPHPFAKLLFAETRLGMTVVVSDQPLAPVLAVTPGLELGLDGANDFLWRPDLSPTGPVSILVSGAARRAVVLRNGKLIGSAALRIEGEITRPQLFTVTGMSAESPVWISLALPGQQATGPLGAKIEAPAGFRERVETLFVPGTTVVVTPDRIDIGRTDSALIDSGKHAPR